MWPAVASAASALLGLSGPTRIHPEPEPRSIEFVYHDFTAVAHVSLGNPGQQRLMGSGFDIGVTRVFGPDSCFAFARCYDINESDSMDIGPFADEMSAHTVYGGISVGGVETPANQALEWVVRRNIEDTYARVSSGRLALSPASWIARRHVMRVSLAVTYSMDPFITRHGFRIDLDAHGDTRRASFRTLGRLKDTRVPLSNNEEWKFQARSIRFEGYGSVTRSLNVRLDLGRPSVSLPHDIFVHLRTRLEMTLHRPLMVVSGRLLLPCDRSKELLMMLDFDLILPSGKSIRIRPAPFNEGIRTYSSDTRAYVCDSSVVYHDKDEIVIGSWALWGRHSVVLDSQNSAITFRDFKDRAPWIIPPLLTRFQVTSLPEFSDMFLTNRGSGGESRLEFPRCDVDCAGRYHLMSTGTQQRSHGGIRAFTFTAARSNRNSREVDLKLPGLVNLSDPKGEVVMDDLMKSAIIPIVTATSSHKPCYKVHVMISPRQIVVMLLPTTPDRPFYDDLEIYKSLDEEDHSNDDCTVCLTQMDGRETLHYIPNCRHEFHADCLRAWVIRKAACPKCTQPIPARALSPRDIYI